MAKECRECKGKVEVVEVDDCSMTVECTVCGEMYNVEPDGFGEGGLEWIEAMMELG